MVQVVNLIAAVGRKGQLGLNGSIPWMTTDDPVMEAAVRTDMALFKQATTGGRLIAGRTTFEGLQKVFTPTYLALTDRDMFCFSRKQYSSAKEMLDKLGDSKPIWIIGGAKTYSVFNFFVNGIRIINEVPYYGPADTYLHLR